MVCVGYFFPTFLYILINMSPFWYDRLLTPVYWGVVWKSDRGYIRDTVHKQTGVGCTGEGLRARLRWVRWSHVDGDAELYIRTVYRAAVRRPGSRLGPWSLHLSERGRPLSSHSLSLFYFNPASLMLIILKKEKRTSTYQEVQWRRAKMHIRIHLMRASS